MSARTGPIFILPKYYDGWKGPRDKDGVPSGKGRFYFNGHHDFTGSVKRKGSCVYLHGFCIRYKNKARLFAGNFKDGLRHGIGTQYKRIGKTKKTKRTFKGMYKNGLIKGRGTIFSKNKKRFTGFVLEKKNKDMELRGTWFKSNGSVHGRGKAIDRYKGGYEWIQFTPRTKKTY